MKSMQVPQDNRLAADPQRGGAAHSLGEFKRQVVQAASRRAGPEVDARQAFGFMPMAMKGAVIRWRGL